MTNLIETLLSLRASTKPGLANGERIKVRYFAFRPATSLAIDQAEVAKNQGMDMNTYTGILDRVWRTLEGHLCFTVLVDANVRCDKYGRPVYRTFNVNKGRLELVERL
jgi:hypothetical protein